ncbi:ROK family protein [Nanoarchaeota archaeon]
MKYSIGVDIGGTKIACGLVDSKGNLRKKVLYKTGKIKKEALNRIKKAVSLLLEGVRDDVKGIGVGIPGTISKTGKLDDLPNLRILEGTDLVGFLKKSFKKKVIMENDASCAALGEYKFGVGRGVKNLYVVTLGTGVGGGVIIDGKLYTGRGNASEPGHMLIGKQEWEDVCSGKALSKFLKKGEKRGYEDYSYYLGIGLSNIIKLYDPELIVLTGGVTIRKDYFLKKAIKVAKQNTFFPICEIKASNFPEDIGIIGAAALIF